MPLPMLLLLPPMQRLNRSDLNYRSFQEGKQRTVLAKGETGKSSTSGRAKGVYMAFCKSCGSAIKPQAKFCSSCGTGVDAQHVGESGTSLAATGRRSMVLLASRCLGVVAVVGGAWLYIQSGDPYGPSADTNNDGVITFDEAEAKLPNLPRARIGKWEADVEIVEFNYEPDIREGIIENLKILVTEVSCNENFRHFYELYQGNTTEKLQKNRIILKELFASCNNVKLIHESPDHEKSIEYIGEYGPNHADFVIHQKDEMGSSKVRIVAKRIGDCDKVQRR